MNKLPFIVEESIKKCTNDDQKFNFFKMMWFKNSELLKKDSIEYNIEKIFDIVKEKYIEFSIQIDHFLIKEPINNTSDLSKYFTLIFDSIFKVNKIINTSEFINNELVKKLNINLLKSVVIENNKYKTYALCHHCYSEVPETPFSFILNGDCFRNEEYNNEFRKSKFKMIELVLFDKQKKLDEYKLKLMYFLIKLGRIISPKKIKLCIANDSFVSDKSELLLYQFIQKSKIELQIYSNKYDKYISISSINMHNNHFSKIFDIFDYDDRFASSMCIGIGLDRVLEFINERVNSK